MVLEWPKDYKGDMYVKQYILHWYTSVVQV